MNTDLPGVDYADQAMDVRRVLDKEIQLVQNATKHSHKVAKVIIIVTESYLRGHIIDSYFSKQC